MNVKVKPTEQLKSIEIGSINDDAISYRFILGKGKEGDIIIADFKTDKKYRCTLRGENDIINFNGESINTNTQYIKINDFLH